MTNSLMFILMWIIYILILLMSFTLIYSHFVKNMHPMVLMMKLFLAVLLITLIISMNYINSIYSLITFLVMISGFLVLFAYFTSLLGKGVDKSYNSTKLLGYTLVFTSIYMLSLMIFIYFLLNMETNLMDIILEYSMTHTYVQPISPLNPKYNKYIIPIYLSDLVKFTFISILILLMFLFMVMKLISKQHKSMRKSLALSNKNLQRKSMN